MRAVNLWRNSSAQLCCGRGRRVGNHGRTPCERQCSCGAPGEYAFNRCRVGGVDSDLRHHLWRALQPSRVGRRRLAGRTELVAGGGYVVAQVVGALVGVALADAMLVSPCTVVATREKRISRSPQRDRRNIWPASVIWMWPPAPQRGADCRWRVHHRRVLVHGINIVRQSRGDTRSGTDEHLCGHSARRRARFPGRTSGRCGGGERLSLDGVPLPAGADRAWCRMTVSERRVLPAIFMRIVGARPRNRRSGPGRSR